jgi:hypothetical protein
MTAPSDWYPKAGWYPAGSPSLLRWWDGTQWTAHTQPTQAPAQTQPTQTPAVHTRPPWPIVGVLAGAAMVVGSFLPWVKATVIFASFSVNGIEGGGDGWGTMALGALIITLFSVVWAGSRNRALFIVAWLAAVAGLVLGAYDWHNANRLVDEAGADVIASVGEGLYLILAGSIVSIAMSIVGWSQDRSN